MIISILLRLNNFEISIHQIKNSKSGDISASIGRLFYFLFLFSTLLSLFSSLLLFHMECNFSLLPSVNPKLLLFYDFTKLCKVLPYASEFYRRGSDAVLQKLMVKQKDESEKLLTCDTHSLNI